MQMGVAQQFRPFAAILGAGGEGLAADEGHATVVNDHHINAGQLFEGGLQCFQFINTVSSGQSIPRRDLMFPGDHFLDELGAAHRIGSVAVGAQLRDIFFFQSRAADDDAEAVTALTDSFQRLNGIAHSFDRGGQQRRKAQHIGLMTGNGLHKGGRGDIDAEVDHFKPFGFQHEAEEVFADIMEIPRHGADKDFSSLGNFHFPLHKVGTDHIDPLMDTAGGNKQLRHIDFVPFKTVADDMHGLEQTVVKDFNHIMAFIEGVLNEFADLIEIAAEYGADNFIIQIFHNTTFGLQTHFD